LSAFLETEDKTDDNWGSSMNDMDDDEVNRIFLNTSRPSTKTHTNQSKSGFPLIPNELYESLSDEVKDILRKQYAYYKGQGGKYKTDNRKPQQLQRVIRALMATPDDAGEQEEDDYQPFQDAISPDEVNQPATDPVALTFQQFLSHRSLNVCHTTRTFNLPSRALHANFATRGEYGRLISYSAMDTGSLTPKFCHIIHQSKQEVLVDGCHPSLTKSFPLASGITAVDLPPGTILI
jgi:hypothetical protein